MWEVVLHSEVGEGAISSVQMGFCVGENTGFWFLEHLKHECCQCLTLKTLKKRGARSKPWDYFPKAHLSCIQLGTWYRCVLFFVVRHGEQGHFQLTFVLRAHPPVLVSQFCEVCICQSWRVETISFCPSSRPETPVIICKELLQLWE